MSKKSARSAQEPAKSEKKTLKSEKCANMDSTWRSFDLHAGSLWPPLSKEKQYVNASIKCSGVQHAWRCKQRGGLGGPRGCKIEAETRKNRRRKTTRFGHRFLQGFDLRFPMIFGWFFEGNAELISNCEWKLRTQKIVIFLRKNAYF